MVSENSLKNLNRGNPVGRGKSGRTKCLDTLDSMLRKSKNQEKLKNELQEVFDRNPAEFFLKFVVPVLPKESKLELAGDQDKPIHTTNPLYEKLSKMDVDDLVKIIHGNK